MRCVLFGRAIKEWPHLLSQWCHTTVVSRLQLHLIEMKWDHVVSLSYLWLHYPHTNTLTPFNPCLFDCTSGGNWIVSWPHLTHGKHHWFSLKYEVSILKLLLIQFISLSFCLFPLTVRVVQQTNPISVYKYKGNISYIFSFWKRICSQPHFFYFLLVLWRSAAESQSTSFS